MPCMLLALFTMATAVVLVSCGDDDEEGGGTVSGKAWITVYRNVSLGAYKNSTLGHFLKLKDGSTVKFSNVTKDMRKQLVLLNHATYPGGENLLSPAGFSGMSYRNDDELYTKDQKGVYCWQPTDMVSSRIGKTLEPFGIEDFNKLANSKDPKEFAKEFLQESIEKRLNSIMDLIIY